MNKIIIGNILINVFLSIIFVLLNNNALKNGFEETFVSLAISYGLITVVLNAVYVAKFCKNKF